MALSICSININGLLDVGKRSGFLVCLRGLPSSVDIVCIQESHCVSSDECASWFRSLGVLSFVPPGLNKSCGCIVLFHPSLSFISLWVDAHGQFLQSEFLLRDVRFRVVCVYAPNRNPDRDSFLPS